MSSKIRHEAKGSDNTDNI